MPPKKKPVQKPKKPAPSGKLMKDSAMKNKKKKKY